MISRLYRGAIAAFLDLPQATNAAIPIKTIFIPICDASPLETWKTIAHTINTQSAIAATGVSFGLMRSSEGNINPVAPSTSTIPVNFTNVTGTCPVHGHIADSFSVGSNNFVKPAQSSITAKRICMSQSIILRALDFFG